LTHHGKLAGLPTEDYHVHFEKRHTGRQGLDKTPQRLPDASVDLMFVHIEYVRENITPLPLLRYLSETVEYLGTDVKRQTGGDGISFAKGIKPLVNFWDEEQSGHLFAALEFISVTRILEILLKIFRF
jgi:hypothetical protein